MNSQDITDFDAIMLNFTKKSIKIQQSNNVGRFKGTDVKYNFFREAELGGHAQIDQSDCSSSTNFFQSANERSWQTLIIRTP